jgi:hypothetical protein
LAFSALTLASLALAALALAALSLTALILIALSHLMFPVLRCDGAIAVTEAMGSASRRS